VHLRVHITLVGLSLVVRRGKGRDRAEQTEHHNHIRNVPSARWAMRAPKALDQVVHRGILLFQGRHAGLNVECAVQLVGVAGNQILNREAAA